VSVLHDEYVVLRIDRLDLALERITMIGGPRRARGERTQRRSGGENRMDAHTLLVYSRATMIWIGTSGYNYPEWKGSFYPPDLPAAKMLPYYSARFPTVEINYTFYRMPNEKLVGGWAAQTPDTYKLTLKAPRRITHDSRLKNCAELVDGFCRVAGTL